MGTTSDGGQIRHAERPGARRSLWLLPSPRIAFAVGVVLAFALGAFLTFAGELKTAENLSTEDPASYIPVGILGVLLVTWFAGWHAVWLIPTATMLIAYGWQELFWDTSNGVSGMDGIGSHPTDVAFVLWAVVPFTVFIAAIRVVVVEIARSTQRWIEG